MRFRDISMKFRVLGVSVFGLLVLAAVITSMYINDIGEQAEIAILERSRAVVQAAESVRNEMGHKLEIGVVTDLDELAERDPALLLEGIPVLTAIAVAEQNAEELGYTFRVPKESPRNPENEPTELELTVLRDMRDNNLEERIIFEDNQIRYFRPIVLTPDCLLCHGFPAGSVDPVGGIREGWQAGEMHGAFQVISSLDQARATQAQAARNIVLVTAAVSAALSLLLLLVVSRILNPLSAYVGNFELASSGDLTAYSDIDTKDEIGTLSGFYNEFLSSINGMIRRIKVTAVDARIIGTELAATAERTASSLEEMKATSESMMSRIERLDGEIITSSKSAKDIRQFISHVRGLIASQAASITQSSAAIEEISASIHTMARSAEDKLVITRQLQETASHGETEMKETVSVINRVADSANVIMEMISVIQGIASQTNLLAMNAAIEAAHAGDAGKGFAVVAGEIRKLAESSARSAQQITGSLEEIRGFIDTSKQTTEKTGGVFADMVSSITKVASGMEEIQYATSELSEGSRQIVTALDTLISTTDDVKEASSEMDSKISNISDSMEQLEGVSAETKVGITEMVTGISEIFSSVEEISASGDKNNQNVKEVEAQLSVFKTDDDT